MVLFPDPLLQLNDMFYNALGDMAEGESVQELHRHIKDFMLLRE